MHFVYLNSVYNRVLPFRDKPVYLIEDTYYTQFP